MTGTVMVVGSINADRVMRCARLPRPGETVLGADVEQHSGGKGANQAVAAARLGARVKLVGATGVDAEATFVREALTGSGVDITAVQHVPTRPTGTAFIAVDEESENLILVASGANRALDPDHVAKEVRGLGPSDVLSLSLETTIDVADQALSAHLGALTVLNLSPVTEDARPLIPRTDILVVNEHELAQLLRIDSETTSLAEIAQLLAAEGARSVIVTRGSKGAWLFSNLSTDDQHVVEHSARQVSAVDTTGCGDAFAGALCAALADGQGVEAATQLGLTVASFAATRVGAQSSYPTRTELTLFTSDR